MHAFDFLDRLLSIQDAEVTESIDTDDADELFKLEEGFETFSWPS
jgi:hypothetical protein